MGLGMSEMIIIFLIVLLLFGARRLPEVAKAMGKAVNEFKHAKDEILNSPTDTINLEQKTPGLPEHKSSASKNHDISD